MNFIGLHIDTNIISKFYHSSTQDDISCVNPTVLSQIVFHNKIFSIIE
ncbi:hypothetical protein HMPREF1584_00003 [Gardnerella vaginalis JCP8481A]|uniref:Uncharacterized protein n=1 Tax=Gardnerella vaginalis TaxID=2702 RepID=A0A133NXF4_GARVA|nr:hypothetical protein HMPREF1584_00003 [Gardnerella vaginalis JCP8481A]KXA20973.1 hypothetical protein HMPREF3208_00699 [Gardnerella vaginalis]